MRPCLHRALRNNLFLTQDSMAWRSSSRFYGYSNHGRPQKLSFEIVPSLKLLKDRIIRGILGFIANDSLMQIRVEGLAGRRIDRLEADPLQRVQQALIDQLDAFAVFRFRAVNLQSPLEIVQDR